MTLVTRVGNRLILFLLALVAFAVAAVAIWPVVTGAPLPLLGALEDARRQSGLSAVSWAWILAGAALVAVIVAVAIVLSRVPRREHTAARMEGVSIDDTVVADLVRSSLGDLPDVLSVSAATERRVVRIRVEVRPRADLASLRARLADAVADTDQRLGLALPLVVQVTAGLRSTFAHERRVV